MGLQYNLEIDSWIYKSLIYNKVTILIYLKNAFLNKAENLEHKKGRKIKICEYYKAIKQKSKKASMLKDKFKRHAVGLLRIPYLLWQRTIPHLEKQHDAGHK